MKSETRPLTSRALTSAIDTLRPHLMEARVLDLYAGAGRFGLAALHEGATHAVFVEKARPQVNFISAELKKHKLEGTVHCEDVARFFARTHEKFSVIFADPPFPLWNAAFAESLFAGVSSVIDAEGIFLVKYPSQMIAFDPVSRFRPWKKTQFGESLLLYFIYGD